MSDPRDVEAWEREVTAAVESIRTGAESLRTLLSGHGRECGCRYCELRDLAILAVSDFDAAGVWVREGEP